MKRVVIKIGKRRYRVIKDGECSNRMCSLFRKGVCDFDGEDEDMPTDLPCDKIVNALQDAGLVVDTCTSYKEVK